MRVTPSHLLAREQAAQVRSVTTKSGGLKFDFHDKLPALVPLAKILAERWSTPKAAVYDLLFRTAAETLITVAADPKHLGARIGLTAVLHTWGLQGECSAIDRS
jgi:hypothetical protein